MEKATPIAAQRGAPLRIRRAETILRSRTDRVILVLEQLVDALNVQAILRTAECMGIQHVFVVDGESKAARRGRVAPASVAKGGARWLTVRRFESIAAVIAAARQMRAAIWVTDLGAAAIPLVPESVQCGQLPLPERIAIVIGRETDGVSSAMREAADAAVYLPLHGFTESLNASVAASLVLQRVFDLFPAVRGAMDSAQRAALRHEWFAQLATSDAQRERFVAWADRAGEIEVLADLRRVDTQSWKPAKVRRREALAGLGRKGDDEAAPASSSGEGGSVSLATRGPGAEAHELAAKRRRGGEGSEE